MLKNLVENPNEDVALNELDRKVFDGLRRNNYGEESTADSLRAALELAYAEIQVEEVGELFDTLFAKATKTLQLRNKMKKEHGFQALFKLIGEAIEMKGWIKNKHNLKSGLNLNYVKIELHNNDAGLNAILKEMLDKSTSNKAIMDVLKNEKGPFFAGFETVLQQKDDLLTNLEATKTKMSAQMDKRNNMINKRNAADDEVENRRKALEQRVALVNTTFAELKANWGDEKAWQALVAELKVGYDTETLQVTSVTGKPTKKGEQPVKDEKKIEAAKDLPKKLAMVLRDARQILHEVQAKGLTRSETQAPKQATKKPVSNKSASEKSPTSGAAGAAAGTQKPRGGAVRPAEA